MTKAKIDSGICGHITHVSASSTDDYQVALDIVSDCPDIQKLAQDPDLAEVNALEEISFRQGEPSILTKGRQHCAHGSCPVPAGIIKVVEVEAGLALPKDVTIRFEKE